MRKLSHILMMIALVTVCAVAAEAQTSSPQRVVAQISFDFHVGRTTLPAGKYEISVINPSSDRTVLQIRNLDGHATAMILTNTVNSAPADNAKLVFERYDDLYIFTNVQMAGEPTSFAALRSKAERKQMVATSAKKRVVVITIG